MKYYSKSPSDIEKSRNNDSKKKTRRWVNIFLFVDLILILAIFLYMNNQQRKEEPGQNETSNRSFSWQGGTITASCNGSNRCALKLDGTFKVHIRNVELRLLDNEEITFKDQRQVTTPARIEFEFMRQRNLKVFFRLLNDKERELISFRAYP